MSNFDEIIADFQSHYKDKIYFAKIRPNAIIPNKREEDMAYDIYACFDEDFIEIQPHTMALIPTGIASAFSSKYGLSLRERGSTGTKLMALRAGEIDSGYRGEIFVAINNTSYKTIYISNNDKSVMEHERKYYTDENVTDEEILELITIYPADKAICQGKLEIVPDVSLQEISYEELKSIPSVRGTGSLGSSGK